MFFANVILYNTNIGNAVDKINAMHLQCCMSLKRELDRIIDCANQIIVAATKIGNSDKLAKSVKELGFSNRALKCLASRDIKYLDELVEMSEQDLMRIRNMGRKTFDEIKHKVKSLGFDCWE